MSEKASQFKIGVFVLVGTAILLAGLFLFGLRNAFEPMHRFETYVTGDVEGLSKGSAVKLRGVAVGKVTDIDFSWNLYPGGTPGCVVVRFEVKESFSPLRVGSQRLGQEVQKNIDRGLRAIVKSEGITGSSVVSIENVDPKEYPPLAVSWTPRYDYVPSAPSQFGQIVASLERTLSNLEKLDVAKIGASVDETLNSASATLKKIGEIDVKGISKSVEHVADNANAAVLEIQGLARDARDTLAQMRLGAVGQDADRLIVELDARLRRLIDKLNAIDVPALNDTLAGTREAAQSLNDALEQIRKQPSQLFFGGPPPPASAVQQKEKP